MTFLGHYHDLDGWLLVLWRGISAYSSNELERHNTLGQIQTDGISLLRLSHFGQSLDGRGYMYTRYNIRHKKRLLTP